MAKKLKLSVFIILLGSKYRESIISKLVKIINYFYNEILLSIEIETGTRVGEGLKIYHGYGIVINKGTVIGRHCTLRNGVVIGNKLRMDGSETGCPKIGDRVNFGANAIAIGEITIGDDVTVGAGAVVVKDVPAGATVVGNPARVIATRS